MTDYIEREALMRQIKEIHCAECDSYHGVRCRACWVDDTLDYIDSEPAADVEPVRHGRWELTVHSFYFDTFDESCELCVYIVANCSECSGNHPNSYQVFSKTIYAPEDAGDDFRWRQATRNKADNVGGVALSCVRWCCWNGGKNAQVRTSAESARFLPRLRTED